MDRRKKRDDVVRLTDLAPNADVKGGAGRVVFGVGEAPVAREVKGDAMATKKKSKDLSPKKSPKGGRLASNDNVTLVRL